MWWENDGFPFAKTCKKVYFLSFSRASDWAPGLLASLGCWFVHCKVLIDSDRVGERGRRIAELLNNQFIHRYIWLWQRITGKNQLEFPVFLWKQATAWAAASSKWTLFSRGLVATPKETPFPKKKLINICKTNPHNVHLSPLPLDLSICSAKMKTCWLSGLW